MAFNKNKALDNALKFLNQGKVAQAIGEYQQILRVDPKDQATLMTVGDLFARQGEMPQAIEYFERLAQVYLNDGFNSKAIAIYKKIAKLAPNELAPLERLADLYVQQGVLSEARPLFLQIAEAHLKANHAPKAIEVLNRLLEVEPENPRVQMRLAELYNVMGKKKEAGQTYLAYAQRLFDRDDHDEAQKLIDRALEVDPTNSAAFLLKAKILIAGEHSDKAIALLERHPEANDGGHVTDLILDLELKSGQTQKAADRARKQLARGHAHFAPLLLVADAMLDGGKAAEALPLLRELRDPMIDAGAQDKFLHSLSTATERLPGQAEPLEMLADFCRHTSDPFRLNAALSQLVDAYTGLGNIPRAEEVLHELVDRNKDDERLVERLNQLRAGGGGAPPKAAPPEDVATTEEEEAPPQPAPVLIAEEPLDEETQRYVSQALTDVDLFSSYGLTQKATHLLESVLERAPRHAPTLERLLDMNLGAGNERRTAELAAQLEQISRERGDTVNADRFSELRLRFQTAAGLTNEELFPAAAAAPAAVQSGTAEQQPTMEASSVGAVPVEEMVATPATATGPAEFEIPLAAPEPEIEDHGAPIAAASPAEPAVASEAPSIEAEQVPASPELQPAAASEEVDLSDEWEAMIQDVESAPAAAETAPDTEPVLAAAEASEPESEAIEIIEEPEVAALEATPFEIAPIETEVSSGEVAPAPGFDFVEEIAPELEAIAHEPAVSEAVVPEAAVSETLALDPAEAVEAAPVPLAAESNEIELLLTPEPTSADGDASAVSTEDLINQLVAELDDLEAPLSAPTMNATPDETVSHVPSVAVGSNGSSATHEELTPILETSAENLNELAGIFEDFRSDMGELPQDEEEDLETHYNLGIAYREMGLLDEAIGEFQKVAKAIQKGKPFPYAMNCSTLLALTFMDKGDPKIASLWYRRALEVPGLDPETVMALRYDLAVSLETAGEPNAALDSFRQVYAMNIDYRDVADHIATLKKA
jgi:pilus assembly protein FimV